MKKINNTMHPFDMVAAMLDGELPLQVAKDVIDQRVEHVLQWGGSDVDDTRTGAQWAGYIQKQLDLMEKEYAASMAGAAYTDDMYRARMVKVAALAMDALFSFDRVHGAQRASDGEGCGQCPACLLKKALGDAAPDGMRVVQVRSGDSLSSLLDALGLVPPGR